MSMFDEIQEEIRGRDLDDPLLNEHYYAVDGFLQRDAILATDQWLDSPASREVLDNYRGECVLVYWGKIVGHGPTFDEAQARAKKHGRPTCGTGIVLVTVPDEYPLLIN